MINDQPRTRDNSVKQMIKVPKSSMYSYNSFKLLSVSTLSFNVYVAF